MTLVGSTFNKSEHELNIMMKKNMVVNFFIVFISKEISVLEGNIESKDEIPWYGVPAVILTAELRIQPFVFAEVV